MPRRTFIAGSLVLLAAPLAAEALETGKVWRIGFLSPYSPDDDKTWRAALRRGLHDLGYVQGSNIVTDRSGPGRAPETFRIDLN
jgi:hypothetical protein